MRQNDDSLALKHCHECQASGARTSASDQLMFSVDVCASDFIINSLYREKKSFVQFMTYFVFCCHVAMRLAEHRVCQVYGKEVDLSAGLDMIVCSSMSCVQIAGGASRTSHQALGFSSSHFLTQTEAITSWPKCC